MNAQVTTHWLRAPGRGATPGGGPRGRDYVIFLLGIPLFFALWATTIGMSPAPALGFRDAYLYIATQVTAAWWANALATHLVTRMAGTTLSRLWLRLVAGFLLAWLPLVLFYQMHSAVFAGLFHTAVRDDVAVALSSDYLLRLARYSLPFLPLWFAGVYGYRYLFGIQWFRAPVPGVGGTRAAAPLPPQAPAAVPPADAIPPAEAAPVVQCPAAAVPLAVHAQEHYVRVWSDERAELIRQRFGDAVTDLPPDRGGRVHRSWWVRWDAVAGVRRRGRSLELELLNGLRVPVSLAHKASVQARFCRGAADRRDASAEGDRQRRSGAPDGREPPASG